MKRQLTETMFFNRMYLELCYLAYGEFSFDEFLKMSLKDRRVRNAFIFYVMSDKECWYRINILSERNLSLRRLITSLFLALKKAEHDNWCQDEVQQLARKLRTKYFNKKEIVQEKFAEDVSDELVKMLASVSNLILNEQEVDESKDQYVKEKFKSIDKNNLLVKL
jgi:hypothetical protein